MYEMAVAAALAGTPLRSVPPPACMKASRGYGKTSSRADAAPGRTSIPSCSGVGPFRGVPLKSFMVHQQGRRSLIRTDADEVTTISTL